MDSLQLTAQLATAASFVERVRGAIVKAAVAVGAELDDGTPRGQLRRSLSVRVLEDSAAWAPQFAWAVATNPSVSHDSPPNDIEYTVNSMWDAFAGAAPPAQD